MAEKIKIIFLGTGSAIPTARRNHPAVLLQFKDENILFDCGEGTQRQFKKAKLNPCKITKILISHWHGDHTLGIPGLLQTLVLNGYNKKLEIYGPRGTKKKVKEIMDFFVKVLKAKNKRDIFAIKENICHSRKEIDQLMKNIKWLKGTPEISKTLGKLYLGLSSLVIALMNDWCTDNGIEVFGPYDVSKQFGSDTILVIREFPRLIPVELWPHSKNYKYKQVKIYTVYKNIKLEVEFVGCHTIFEGNLSENLLKFALTVDREYIGNPKTIDNLSDYFIKLAEGQQKRVKDLSFEDLKRKIIAQEFYQLKDFFDLVGIDFKPPSEFIKRIKDKKLSKGRYPLKTTGMSTDKISKHFGVNNLKKLYF